jgi:hypothetical protein
MTEFNPEAIDGDGDGIVQEGTEFERPVDAPLEAPESVVEAVEEPAPTVEPKKAPKGFIVALDGDNYEAVAERLGIDKFELYELNQAQPIYPGTLLRKK